MKNLIRRALLGSLLAFVALTLIGAPAHADTGAGGGTPGDMMVVLPAVPAGVLMLLAFFSPYAIAALNGALPFVKHAWQRKVVSVVVSLLLTALVLVFYYAMTGDVVPSWPAFVLLGIVVAAASYGLVTKDSAARVEAAASTHPATGG